MKYLLMSIMSLTFLMYSFTNYTSETAMSIQVKDKVMEFATAIELRDATQLDHLLHKDFRVVANQYPTKDKLSILPKEVYLSLIKSEKIGGTKYDVKFDYVSVEDHSATVIAKFKGQKSNMYLTLLLIKIADDCFFFASAVADGTKK